MSQTGRGGTDRRARIAAQRAAEHKARVRVRMLLAGGAIVAVVAIVVAFALISGRNSGSGTAGPAGPVPTGAALDAVVTKVTSVPPSALEQVGAGQVSQSPTTISGQPLTASGKPEVLYIGAEYCPFCAAERWALAVALSRFGTFTGLAATHSAARNGAGNAEPFPNTSTLTFANARFTSRYLTFTPVETQTNIPDPASGGYTSLQTPTSAQQAVFSKYGAASGGAIPFIDYGNKYLSVGASYNPQVLNRLTWQQIAAALHNPATPVARSVLGAANYATAAICGITGDQPASACTPAVKALRARILRSGQPEVPLSFSPRTRCRIPIPCWAWVKRAGRSRHQTGGRRSPRSRRPSGGGSRSSGSTGPADRSSPWWRSCSRSS